MPSAATPSASAWRPELKWAGVLLGMALGGFFDGILLHQILQWHHLLSAVEGQPWLDLRMQLVADGLFHVLMHAVLATGLALLVGAAGWQAAPAAGSDDALVVFRPSATSAQASMRLAGSMARWCEPTAPVRCGRSSWTRRKMPAPCTATARCWSAIPPSPWAAFPGPGRWSWQAPEKLQRPGWHSSAALKATHFTFIGKQIDSASRLKPGDFFCKQPWRRVAFSGK